jgi:hypothetical protein
MSDSTTAARTATLVALPIAVGVALVSVRLLGGFGNAGPAQPKPQSTTPVAMTAPALDSQQAEACRTLVASLPTALRDRPRRPVTAGAGLNAAYGDPPITMTCGAARATVPVGGDVYVLSGVCWYPEPAGAAATSWTTVDRAIPVRVDVPNSYESQGQWVIAFSPAASALPVAADTPAGCTQASVQPDASP